MRFQTCAVAMGLAALTGTPCLALTLQSAPPRPDVAQQLRPTSTPASSGLAAFSEFQGRPQLGQGLPAPTSVGTTTFGFGGVRAITTVTPRGQFYWNGAAQRGEGNPRSLLPRGAERVR